MIANNFPIIFGIVCLLLIAGFAIAGSRKRPRRDIAAPEVKDTSAGRAIVNGGEV